MKNFMIVVLALTLGACTTTMNNLYCKNREVVNLLHKSWLVYGRLY